MLNKKVSDLLNEQINKELYSAYLYLDMNNYFDKRGLNGFANWYMIQDRRLHAGKPRGFLLRLVLHHDA